MKADGEDSMQKHAKQNLRHAEAHVLREKWVEENEGKTLAH